MTCSHLWLDAEGNIDWDACAYEAQEYQRRWEEINYWVQVEAAAELHTMDVLMDCATPPVARVQAVPDDLRCDCASCSDPYLPHEL